METKGRWMKPTRKFTYREYKCSKCGNEDYRQIDHLGRYKPFKFCPACGHRMEEYTDDQVN